MNVLVAALFLSQYIVYLADDMHIPQSKEVLEASLNASEEPYTVGKIPHPTSVARVRGKYCNIENENHVIYLLY